MMTVKQAEQPTKDGVAARARRPSALKWISSPHVCCMLLLGVIVFFALVRFRLRAIPLERDEGEFAYGGQLIVQGSPLYKGVYTLKLPGTYAAYAVIFRVVGQSAANIHIGLIFVNAATTLLLFFICMRVFGGLAGLVAGASYALLSTSASVIGFAAHATHFVVLFATAGVWLLLESLDKDSSWILLCAGILFGFAFLMKQPGVFFFIWAAFYLLWLGRKRKTTLRKLAAQLLALSIGFAFPFAITCFLTWRSGSLHDLWFWTVLYANQYGANADLKYGLEELLRTGADVVTQAVGIWLLAALGVTALLWDARVRSHALFMASFLLFSFAAVCPGFYFRQHYFILMLPAVSMLAGMGVSSATEGSRRWTGSNTLAAVPILLFVVAFAAAICSQRDFLFYLSPIEASRKVYGLNPFPEAIEISRYIENTTHEGATVAVLGCEPEIYFYSHRHAATGHGCAYPLLEPRYGVNLQRQMEHEIEAVRPDILVLVNDPTSWIAFPNTASPDEILGWTNEYSKQYYVLDGIAEMDPYTTNYYWGERARRHPLFASRNILVLKRKSSSVPES